MRFLVFNVPSVFLFYGLHSLGSSTSLLAVNIVFGKNESIFRHIVKFVLMLFTLPGKTAVFMRLKRKSALLKGSKKTYLKLMLLFQSYFSLTNHNHVGLLLVSS